MKYALYCNEEYLESFDSKEKAMKVSKLYAKFGVSVEIKEICDGLANLLDRSDGYKYLIKRMRRALKNEVEDFYAEDCEESEWVKGIKKAYEELMDTLSNMEGW